MARTWSFLSNYGLVMLAVTRQPVLRLREIAEAVGITTRSAQTIVSDLVEAGFLVRQRVGRRNVYQVRGGRALPDPGASDHAVSDLLGALVSGTKPTSSRRGTRHALVLACSDHRFQKPLRDLMASQGLMTETEVVLWPGGAGALTGPEASLLLEIMAAAVDRGRVQRVILVAHENCHTRTAFDRGTADVFTHVRDVRARRERTIRQVAEALGVLPETWYLDGRGARRLNAMTHLDRVGHRTTEAAS